MKTKFLKSVTLMAVFTGIFASCVNDDNYGVPNLDCIETTLVKTKEVSQIPASPIVTQYLADDVIEAYVTSSDEGGNFFKSISFQTLNGSHGFSVPVDVSSTFTNFQPGRKVLIKMKGLYTDSPNSGTIGMRIGDIFISPSSGSAAVGRLSEDKYKKVLNKSCIIINENDLVIPVTVQQAQSDAYLNRLIELDNVQFTDSAILSNYYDPNNQVGGATNHYLIDRNGNGVIFRTSSFAKYANKPVASGSGKVRGIMTRFGNDYQFVARTENDIKLTGPRFVPLLNEQFSTQASFDAWTKVSVTGTEVWSFRSSNGNPGGCASMSGYSGTNRANEDWLISPAQDLSDLTSAVLSFDNGFSFTGNPIKAFISNNYSGSGTPYAAGVTWTEFTNFTLSPGNYTWANSGNLNLSSFIGAGNNTVYIAFRYTSTTAAASTWRIDNVKITGN
jgi:hypothetical protein